MRLFIPTIGTHLKLLKDWNFLLIPEYRNSVIWKAFGYATSNSTIYDFCHENPRDSILPADTILSVDRIYIRKGIGDYDSLTFRILDCPDPRFRSPKKKGTLSGVARFWVKLHDANVMDIEVI